MRAYVLCKNEEANIARCLEALKHCGVETLVLDSGSTDGTLEIARRCGVPIRNYRYMNHCHAYNELTMGLDVRDTCLIVDADVIVSAGLVREAKCHLQSGADVVQAPVQMIYNGRPLRYASLYPPKPFAFRGGREYFVPAGSGERLKRDVLVATTKLQLVHDDRKPFDRFVENQLRYARDFCSRVANGDLTWKDRVRRASPFGIVAVPFMTLFLKLGILDGRAGLLYAVDRLLVETIKYRYILSLHFDTDDKTN